MQYGYFDDASREYVITNPKTPVKWINYVGTLGFGGFVDHTGGALICKGDPSLNRIVKYIQQTPSSDFKGETLYIRFRQNEKYKVFPRFSFPHSMLTTSLNPMWGWDIKGSYPNFMV